MLAEAVVQRLRRDGLALGRAQQREKVPSTKGTDACAS